MLGKKQKLIIRALRQGCQLHSVYTPFMKKKRSISLASIEGPFNTKFRQREIDVLMSRGIIKIIRFRIVGGQQSPYRGATVKEFGLTDYGRKCTQIW